MDSNQILTFFEYNYWANARILDVAASVSTDFFTAEAELSHGSLRATLVHILAAEQVWRMRCQEGISPTDLLHEENFPDLEALRQYWDAEEKAMRAYLSGLEDQDLLETVVYKTTRGTPHRDPLWKILLHVGNHGTQFRSEAALYLTRLDHSPGNLDFIAFLRE